MSLFVLENRPLLLKGIPLLLQLLHLRLIPFLVFGLDLHHPGFVIPELVQGHVKKFLVGPGERANQEEDKEACSADENQFPWNFHVLVFLHSAGVKSM